MVRHLLLALGMWIGANSLLAQDGGNQVLFEALGRTDCAIIPLWPSGVGPGETKPDLPDGFQRTPEGTLVFRPVVKSELIVIPPPPGTRATGVTVLFCPGGGYGALETASILQGSRWLNAMGATAVLLNCGTCSVPTSRSFPCGQPVHGPTIRCNPAPMVRR